FAYELAVIIRDGIHRMFERHEDIFYYLTVQNEPYPQPPMPEGAADGILQGLYKFRPATDPGERPRVHLFGSGAILREALAAQELLADEFHVAADVWSATSYTLLRREALEVERRNRLHPGEPAGTPLITALLEAEPWPVVAATDYVKAIPDQVARWVPSSLYPLGTDGFGRSESRSRLRDYFEVNAAHIALAALHQLARCGRIDSARVQEALQRLQIDAEKPSPAAP
ncbi:MAG: transketolase-like TK C-terminal-containing protein, partial [Planctomycetota bacterium]